MTGKEQLGFAVGCGNLKRLDLLKLVALDVGFQFEEDARVRLKCNHSPGRSNQTGSQKAEKTPVCSGVNESHARTQPASDQSALLGFITTGKKNRAGNVVTERTVKSVSTQGTAHAANALLGTAMTQTSERLPSG